MFQRNAIGHSVDFAITAKQALEFLKNNLYDAIYLDHDLEEEHYNSNEDHHEDGRHVARHLREMTQHHGKTVIIHSLNPPGRASIKSLLDEHFDVWMPENIRVAELWKIEVTVLFGAIEKYKLQSKE